MAVINLKVSNTVELAYKYLTRGIALVPLHPQTKRPTKNNWQEDVITDPEKASMFEKCNIGFILGSKSRSLVDVDLDTEEARVLAPYILPYTPWVFGRKSNKKSHYLYQVKKAKTRKYLIPGSSGSVILEIRSDGAQTMAPGSTHPDNEVVRWESKDWEDEPPSSLELSDLYQACNELAAAALVLKHGWVSGKRDEVALALCGLLLRAEWDTDEVDEWLSALARASGDEELDMRLKAEYQKERLANDERVPGIPRLMDLMGKEITEKVLELMHLTSSNIIDQMNDHACIINDGGRVKIFKKRTAQLMDLQSAQVDMAVFKVKERNDRGKMVEKRAFPAWVESNKAERYDGFIFEPCGAASHGGSLNLWRGFEEYPEHQSLSLAQLKTKCPAILRHLEEFVCQGNEEYYQYLIDWLSHLVQFPEEVPGVALVLRGEKGSGKTVLAYYIKRMMANRYAAIITNPKHVFGRFNSVLRNKIFACLDDIHWSGQHEEESVLKNIITGEELTLERKFAEVEEARSFIRLMIATNSSWAAPVGRMERRFFVLDLPAWLAPQNPSVSPRRRREALNHFSELREEMKGEGPSYLYSYLSRRKIKTKLFPAALPITQGYIDCQQLSVMHQNPLESWAQDCITENSWERLAYSVNEAELRVDTEKLYNHYAQSLGTKAKLKLSKIQFSKELKLLIPKVKVVTRPARRNDGGKTSVRVYVIPCRDDLIKYFGYKHGIFLDE